jgi:hypothetical protein
LQDLSEAEQQKTARNEYPVPERLAFEKRE